MKPPVVLTDVPSMTEAQLIVGLLQANDIRATTLADNASGEYPQLQLTEGVRVLVAPEDETRARELLAGL